MNNRGIDRSLICHVYEKSPNFESFPNSCQNLPEEESELSSCVPSLGRDRLMAHLIDPLIK